MKAIAIQKTLAAEDYHGYAWRLARRYGRYHVLLTPDDVYQVAMIGLLEWWRDKPEDPPTKAFNAMRWAVLKELKMLLRSNRNAFQEPIEEVRHIAGTTNIETEVIAIESRVTLGRLLDHLPDIEFQMIALRIIGHHPIPVMVREGWKPRQAAQIYKTARKRLRMWMEESA